MTMTKPEFIQFIKNADFKTLFNEMGWDYPKLKDDIRLPIDTIDYCLSPVAQKQGLYVYVCAVPEEMPQHALCHRLNMLLKKYSNDYILIFTNLAQPGHHLWMVSARGTEKRDIVTVEYRTLDQASFLFEKVQNISFPVEKAVTIVEVVEQVQHTFAVNATNITKKFYSDFSKQHTAFCKFITGINGLEECPEREECKKCEKKQKEKHEKCRERHWYTSVMLNRLMFCYFVQKKGFLNFDTDYLRTKLNETQAQKGKDKFYEGFYKGFLKAFFHEGLNAPQHSEAFIAQYGRIPYLNGGIFDYHALEQCHHDIDIPDKAFEKLFKFFDEWRWHLDTRITASGKDINPDVLGYIFEQYINDRAEMGAYYTKEDITDYIGKNCIIPFLMETVAKTSSKHHFHPTEGFVWQELKNSNDTYIYPAVKKGVALPLPPEIENGVDTQAPNLLERRAGWNAPAPESHALPTEIWRETIARRQRYHELHKKITAGKIVQINDFITYNLNIRQFVEDVLTKTEDHKLILHFYQALRKVTILDPTCGSGAFLFAALNILEPLYEICIERMQEFNASNKHLFKEELAELDSKCRSNIQYFIYKSIILRNLYGVDIMHEATEIAKLRLFLKLVAVVDVNPRDENLGLDPLPDIDFNIRSGNTLVGFASPDDVRKGVTPEGELALYNDVYQKVETKASDIARLYARFKQLQLADQGSSDFHAVKLELRQKLEDLNAELDFALAKTVYSLAPDTLTGNKEFQAWKRTHRPFHWYSEFYDIIVGNKGFDVIIGNPPYVSWAERNSLYKLFNYATISCGNLYAYCIERSKQLVKTKSRLSMIVPISLVGNNKFHPARMILTKAGFLWASFFSGDTHPGTLFEGVQQNLLIFLHEVNKNEGVSYTTNFLRFADSTGERNQLFTTRINYIPNILGSQCHLLKISEDLAKCILTKIMQFQPLQSYISPSSNTAKLFYHDVVHYWAKVFLNPPYFSRSGEQQTKSSHYKMIPIRKNLLNPTLAALSSSLYYFWYIIRSNGRDVSSADVLSFPVCFEKPLLLAELSTVATIYLAQLQKTKQKVVYKKASGTVEYHQYWVEKVKTVADEIDRVLAEHYGFTDEELDYIINYDIKYRMGDSLNEGGE